MNYPGSLQATLIAPCGMDCGLCSQHLREKNVCDGCRTDSALNTKHCVVCRIRNCAEIGGSQSGFCFECARFPCARLRQLDKRYRTRYGMSMIENLERIRTQGLVAFIASEQVRWRCPECGGVVCVHKDDCIYCGHARG